MLEHEESKMKESIVSIWSPLIEKRDTQYKYAQDIGVTQSRVELIVSRDRTGYLEGVMYYLGFKAGIRAL